MRGERHAPPPHVALKNSGGESNRETPHGGGVRRAEKRGGGVKERNSSRCVTEYYITPSLHTHGAHSHTRGGQPARSRTGRGRGPVGTVPELEEWEGSTTHIGHRVPCPAPVGGSIHDVHATLWTCDSHVHTPGSAALHTVNTQLTPSPKITHTCTKAFTQSKL